MPAWGDLDAITINGDSTVVDGTGNDVPGQGTVTITFPDSLKEIRDAGSNLIIVPNLVTARFDVDGLIKRNDLTGALILPRSDDPQVDPTDWSYHAVVNWSNSSVKGDEFDFVLLGANGSTQSWASLPRVQPLGGFDSTASEAEAVAIRARLDALEAEGLAPGGELTFVKSGTVVPEVGKIRKYVHTTKTIDYVFISVGTGGTPVGGSLIVDVKKNLSTIFTTGGHRPTIAAGGQTNQSPAPDITSVIDGDFFTVDLIAGAGNTFLGSDLTVDIVAH